jgi:hypothetical protein
MPHILTGACACGAVRYECSATPVVCANCHCRDCQRSSGGAFVPTVVVPAAALVVKGEPRYHTVVRENGALVRRAFCGDCGSPLFGASSRASELVGIKVASLDDPSWFRPMLDLWTDSAQPWDHMDPTVPKLARGFSPVQVA